MTINKIKNAVHLLFVHVLPEIPKEKRNRLNNKPYSYVEKYVGTLSITILLKKKPPLR